MFFAVLSKLTAVFLCTRMYLTDIIRPHVTCYTDQ